MRGKLKYSITLVLFLLIALCITTQVNAAETFTTEDGIVATKEITSFTSGNIDFKLSNIPLVSDGNYEWLITTSETVDLTDEDLDWYVLGDFSASKSTATVSLTITNKDVLAVLRKTNEAYLFVKNSDNNTLIIDGLAVDLTLPPLYAFDIYERWDSYYIIGEPNEQWGGATYSIDTAYYKFEKITDETLIANYKKAIAEGTSLASVFSITPDDVEGVEGWNPCSNDYSYPSTKIDETEIPTEQGVYYLWIKAKDADSKTLYGCLILSIDGDGPTVEEIYVDSPASGTYATGQTVKIRVDFSEHITATTVPTLKIRFGNSDVREVTNGTVVNSDWRNSAYIEYSYNIQDGDEGQLATVDLTGGEVKDTSGNAAILTSPVMTGNTIKANVEGTITNNTENQDKTENEDKDDEEDKTTTDSDDKKEDSTSNKGTSSSGSSSSKDTNKESTSGSTDKTTAPGTLPQTGLGIGLIVSIVALIAFGGIAISKYNKLKGF